MTEAGSDVSHCSSAAQLNSDPTMFIHCELLMAMLALTLDGRVHAGGIIGGREAVAHSRPYMVLLYMYKENGDIHHCDGSLLNEDFVMTAAHCKAKSYEVLLGVHNVRNSNEKHQRISVAQTFPHEDYNASNYSINDIMLLKLSSKAQFTKSVKPIALADKDDVALPKSCLVSGWGKTAQNTISEVLQEVNVTLTDEKVCTAYKMYCSEGPTGPGNGDSGGPLVCEDEKAYGVVSIMLEPHSGPPNIYTFIKIPDFRSWIDSTMTNALKSSDARDD